jgi:hypothetical protein
MDRHRSIKPGDERLRQENGNYPERYIPCGAYCYFPSEDALGDARRLYPRKKKLYRCPFWERKTRRTGYCRYLGDGRPHRMVKACGVNTGYGYYFGEFMKGRGAPPAALDDGLLRSVFEKMAAEFFDIRRDTFFSGDFMDRMEADLLERNISFPGFESVLTEIMRFLAEKRGLSMASFEYYGNELRRRLWSVLARLAEIRPGELDDITAAILQCFASESGEISSSSVLGKALKADALKRFRTGIVEELVMSAFYFYNDKGVLK